MTSLPPFPFICFFWEILSQRKRDRLTFKHTVLHWKELSPLRAAPCAYVLTSTPSAQTDNYTLRWAASPRLYLKSLRTFFCKQCHSSCQSDLFVFLLSVSLLCDYDVLWLLPPHRCAWSALSVASLAERQVSITCQSYWSKGGKAVRKHYNKWFRDFCVASSFTLVFISLKKTPTLSESIVGFITCSPDTLMTVFLGQQEEGVSLQ